MELEFRLTAFEGPLDLLLHLIEKNKINIYDIPIAEITDQYMEYIEEMKRRDLNVMSEFLVMAAELLSIKSRMLLPPEETEDEDEETDPRAELVARLLEYKMFKTISGELRDRQTDAEHVVFRAPTIPDEVLAYEEPVDVEEIVSGVTLSMLNDVFLSLLRRQKLRVDPIRSGFGEIPKEPVSVEEKMDFVSSYLKRKHRCSFRQILEDSSSKEEVIVTFLSVLELMKSGEIEIKQDVPFGEIDIRLREEAA